VTNTVTGRLRLEWNRRLEAFRLRVSRTDAIAERCLLGVVSGALAATVIIAFRSLVEHAQNAFLPHYYDYESLDPAWRIVLALGGGAVLGLLFQVLPVTMRRVGVTHIIERLDYHQGRLPWGNAVVQFVGGAIALISGQSVGREGPCIHLGAASGNVPCQRLRLPNNALRIVGTCGAAAGIAATFNTPLAGVAFAMEVLMMEAAVATIAPVILATVTATTLTRFAFGADLAFSVPPLRMGSLDELPLILLMGMALGAVAAAFIRLLRLFYEGGQRLPLWLRPVAAGALVGLAALAVPQVMGIGYDTVNDALRDHLAIWLLAAMVLAKVVATSAAVGLGVPGGLIGPSLVIGAMGGGLFGAIVKSFDLIPGVSVGFHVMLGMGAMMAGTLQAPLAGLLAILELTGNPNIIFPGMLAVIAATLTSGYLHGRESAFQALLRAMGVDYRNDRIARGLRQVGVAAVMNLGFVELPRRVARTAAAQALEGKPRWVLLRRDGATALLMPAVDLARTLQEQPDVAELDLLAMPADRFTATPIDFQASLQEAEEELRRTGAEVLYVTRLTVPGLPRVYGVLTRDDMLGGYRY
jgi:CIC family chloride channel protein